MFKKHLNLWVSPKTRRFLIGAIAALLIICTYAFQVKKENNGFILAKRAMAFREIGHKLLLHSGDSTSRVLPVRHLSDEEYQIAFEKELTFQPDTLLAIVKNSISKTDLGRKYIVSVINCEKKDVLFGFAILEEQKNNIIPCSGRIQPKRCYLIDIKFEKSIWTASTGNYLVTGLSLFTLMGLLIGSPAKPRHKRTPSIETWKEIIVLGNTFYDADKKSLLFGEASVALTDKENRILKILSSAPESIIERNTLQKRIWEDEGVIVGRSLDMFISRLRKKLSKDDRIQIINIHGKGYRLSIKPAEC